MGRVDEYLSVFHVVRCILRALIEDVRNGTTMSGETAHSMRFHFLPSKAMRSLAPIDHISSGQAVRW